MTARISRGKPTYYASGCPDTALTGVAYMRLHEGVWVLLSLSTKLWRVH